MKKTVATLVLASPLVLPRAAPPSVCLTERKSEEGTDDHFAEYFDEIPPHTREIRNWGAEGVAPFPAIPEQSARNLRFTGKQTARHHSIFKSSDLACAQLIPARTPALAFDTHLSFIAIM